MADKITNFQCPACTGPLHYDGESGRLRCDYCGSLFTVKEIEELYALSKYLPLYDRVILTEYGPGGQIKTETIDIDRRDKGCVSSILSRRKGTAAN